jgi:uncharacterized 2Fe-2S/4Fe-4S cluster protein (DUF4445 family)
MDFEHESIYTVTVNKPPYKIKGKDGELLSDVLRRVGMILSMPCGGNGRCGKCCVMVDGEKRLACRTYIKNDMTVVLPDENSAAIETDILRRGVKARGSGIGVAADIGTTTLAVYAVDLQTEEIIAKQAELNDQRAYGADVISRVAYCMENENGLSRLSDIIRKQLAQMARRAAGGRRIERMVIAGNTVMEHILLACDLSGFAAAPFTPVFLSGQNTEIDKIPVRTMPCISPYIGGDITAAIISCSMDKADEPCMLIDLGTNGEMVLKKNGVYYCCSVAAGPAFEGGHISCGTGSVEGAVRSVRLSGGLVYADTIGKSASVGICGSGLIEAAAELRREKIIDDTGRIMSLPEQSGEWRRYIASDASAVTLTPSVRITQKDVRELQMAKAAVRAGIEMLLKKASLEYNDIKQVFLAGGMGTNLPEKAARSIGMLPEQWTGIARAVGNAAGSGAVSGLMDSSFMELAEDIRKNSRIVELANESEFADLYIKHMNF